MNRKLVVGILCGGKSAEHEVSLQSAKNVFDAINRDVYTPVLIGIDKNGLWRVSKQAEGFILHADDPARIALNDSSSRADLFPESRGLLRMPGMPSTHSGHGAEKGNPDGSLRLDVVFPLLHGPFGEDGAAQGFLKLAGVPFVGAGVLGSAVGMDKDVMKRLLRDAGLPMCAFIAVRSRETPPSYEEASARLGSTLFVKPANMGSSVGISKARNEDEYNAAVREAFQYDTKIIIEEYVKGREIECSVMGNEDAIASVPGEIISSYDFYSYSAKYLDETGARLEIPAKIPPETTALIQDLAIQTFKTLSCEGLSRVDFFLKEDGTPLVNEINTMPGFTKISMYPKLWEASGISYSDLIDRLIQLAIRRFEREETLRTSVQ